MATDGDNYLIRGIVESLGRKLYRGVSDAPHGRIQ